MKYVENRKKSSVQAIDTIRSSLIHDIDKAKYLRDPDEVDALFTFMEMVSIQDVIRWKEEVRMKNIHEKAIKIPQCILSSTMYDPDDPFDFDEKSMELLKRHFQFR